MYKNILICIDLGEEMSWSRALNEAVALTQASGGILHVATVVPDFGMSIVGSFFPSDFEKKAIEAARQKLHELTEARIPKGIKLQHIVCHGSPATEILEAAKEVSPDLIVIGSHQPGFDHAMLGSVATKLVSKAECSVLVVRSRTE